MSFFYRHRVLSTIVAVLLVLLLLLLASSAFKEKDNFIGTVSKTIFTGFQKPFAAMARGLGNAFGGAFSDEALLAENQKLTEELSAAQSELTTERLNREELTELQKLQGIFGGDADIARFSVKTANVFSLDGSSVFNVFSIDVGSNDGVERNTVVLSGDGLIGRVVSSEANSAKVVPILNENNKIGFQIKGEQDYLGICNGDGKGFLVGNLFDEGATVKVGDPVFTSGIGGLYPAGISLGTVVEAEMNEETPLLYVKIEPAVYFLGLKKVAVLI